MISTLIGRLSAVHDNHKRIAAGTLLIGALTLGAKLFVAAREMAIAWRYGISPTTDSYQLAITITTWLPMLINGVMTVVLVPRLVVLGRDSAERRVFLNELNGSVAILGLGMSVLIWFAAPAAAGVLASGVNAYTLRTTAAISSEIAPIVFCLIMCGYFSTRLQAREWFSYSGTEAIPALLIAIFVVLPLGLGGIAPLIAGTLVGYVLQMLVLGAMTHRGDPPVGAVTIRHSSPEWRSLYSALTLMVLGQLLITVAGPIDQAFAALVRFKGNSITGAGEPVRLESAGHCSKAIEPRPIASPCWHYGGWWQP